MHWMLLPLKRYADFRGRSRRLEYWMFSLGLVIVYVILILLLPFMAGGESGTDHPLFGLLLVAVGLALFLPALAVQVRRFHDQGRSGWLVLLGLIPVIGSLILLVMMCLPGEKGPNAYGPDPFDPEGVATFSEVFS